MGKVRPQIYETTPVAEIIKQLRREVMPVPFIRRMRVINTLSAVTLRKIEDKTLLPFDVMDIHHVLDKQISQDAIIAILENEGLAIAIDSGNLQPLWEESANLPLLRKGFEQGWIQRFILLPFDPICIMLALRAKLLLDAVDEFGHSYNLLRSMGMGWIDFGMIEGEEPGDPNSYIPPGIDQPINYPEGIPMPGPTDPGYVPGPGDPGYVEPAGVTTTFGSAADSPTGPSTLDLSPGSLLGGAGASAGALAGGRNCCINIDDPEAFVSIGYFTDSIDAGETLGLTVEHAHEDCDGANYEWIEVNGVGSLSAGSGLDVIYTAPEDGANCPGNAEIWLLCGGEVVDALVVTINYDYAIAFVYPDPETEVAQNDSVVVNVTANGTPLTWAVSGTGFSLEHAETAGTGNVLHADGTACGAATITITDCDGNQAVGHVRCTTGLWVLKSNTCGLSGVGSLTVLGLNFDVELIRGNQKQYTYYTNNVSFVDKVGDVDCVASIVEICVGVQDCLTFTLPCFDIWAGTAYACSELECITGCTKLPFTETYRCNYVRYTPEHYYYEWECAA